MANNRLIIAAAGSGKTTYLVKRALEIKDQTVLVTTYTEANELEIRRKFVEINKFIPSNITIQTWFSFLLQHGVKPFQGGVYASDIAGMLLVNEQSGLWFRDKKNKPVYYSEDKYFEKHYLSVNSKLYSDKIAKFVIRCNEKSGGAVIDRLTRIFQHVFVDEVQDLAGYDLEILKLLFQSKTSIMLVGDPRQVTYLTHNERLHSGYKDGKIDAFIADKCQKDACEIDRETLGVSHRNCKELCDFSSKLFPDYPPTTPCDCIGCRTTKSKHNGLFLVRSIDVHQYTSEYNPAVLRHSGARENEWNFGKSKGLTFDRILIYPTETIMDYLRTGNLTKKVAGKIKPALDISKFYVAVTRPRFSVGIVCDFNNEDRFIQGVNFYDGANI